jgi:hypothetical protein
MTLKKCRICKKDKNISYFKTSTRKGSGDGLAATCTPCAEVENAGKAERSKRKKKIVNDENVPPPGQGTSVSNVEDGEEHCADEFRDLGTVTLHAFCKAIANKEVLTSVHAKVDIPVLQRDPDTTDPNRKRGQTIAENVWDVTGYRFL